MINNYECLKNFISKITVEYNTDLYQSLFFLINFHNFKKILTGSEILSGGRDTDLIIPSVFVVIGDFTG